MAINSLPASTSLLEEVNWLAPGRDRRSDGTIGDAAHRHSVSDHNPDETGNTGGKADTDRIDEVHARDIDSSGPWPAGWSMERIVQIILARCRSGAETRLDYIIFNRRIWSRSTGWSVRAYEGSNPHDKHSHFSFRYGSGSGTANPENRTGPWGIRAAREQEWDLMATEAEVRQAARDALLDLFKDAYYGAQAVLAPGTPAGNVYGKGNDQQQGEMRFVRDVLSTVVWYGVFALDRIPNPWPESGGNPAITGANALKDAAGARADLVEVRSRVAAVEGRQLAIEGKLDQVIALLSAQD